MSAVRTGVWLVLCLVACVACSGIRVQTDYDPAVDFSSLRSYAWLDARSGIQGDRDDVTSLLDRRLRAAIDDELGAKGLARSEADQAGLLVTYHLSIDQKLEVDTYQSTVGYGRGWYGGVGTTQTTVREYEEGTLLIDLVDAASKQLVWRGSGQARVRRSSSPEQRETRVRQAVRAILKDFPPGIED